MINHSNEKHPNIEIQIEELRKAIRKNDFKAYEQCIKQKPQLINAKDDDGIYCLLRAAMDIHSEFYAYLNLNFKEISMQWFREDMKMSLYDLIDGIDDYNFDLKINNQDKAAWFKKGEILFVLKSYEEALVCSDELLKLDKNKYESWLNKSITLLQLRRYGETSACFDEALKLDEKNDMPLSIKIPMLMALGRYEEVLAHSNQDLEKNENNHMFWSVRGELYLLLHRYEEALMCYNKALKLDETSDEYWKIKADILRYLNRHEEALSCYDEALKLDKDVEAFWNNKGNALYNLNRHEEALNCYDEALKLDKHYIQSWNNKGNVLFELQRYYESLECFEKVIELNKHDISVKQDKASVLLALKNFDLAKELMNQSLQMISEATGNKEYLFAEGHQGLAIIAESINEMETASEHFQKLQTYFANLSIQDKILVLESKLRAYRALQPQKVQSVLEEIKAIDAHHPMAKRILAMYEGKKTQTLVSSNNMGELLQTQGSFKIDMKSEKEHQEQPENPQPISKLFFQKG